MGEHIQTRSLPRTGQCRMQRIYCGHPERETDATCPRCVTAQRISKVGLRKRHGEFAMKKRKKQPTCEDYPRIPFGREGYRITTIMSRLQCCVQWARGRGGSQSIRISVCLLAPVMR